MVGGDDWTYSYFLDGGGLDLNARLGVLYEGTNTVFWVSIQGRLSGDAIYTAELLDGVSAGEEFSIERTHSTYDVELPGGAQVIVERAEITFPSSGCWQLRVESEDVSFEQTVYVYPPAGDRAEAARDHERLYTIDLDGRLNGIDLETGARFLSIWVGAYADVALSPDGLTLYAVGYADGGWLAAYNAITGNELWSVSREYSKVGYLGDGGPSTITVSASGDTLYVFESDFQDSQPHRMVAAYDSASGQFIARVPFPDDNVFLNSCAASLWPSLADSQLLAVCKGGSNFITLDMDSGESSGSTGVPVSGETMETVGAVDGALAYVITGQGNVAIFDRETLEVTDRIELIDDGRPAWSGAALSPDGSRLYVALRSVETGAYFREVRVFDTATWEEVERFELDFDGFGRSMAVDSVGNLYGIELRNRETSYPSNTQVWKRDAATGEVTVMLVADAEVHQLLLAP
jgi:DNA-binding beta-propeller fold protein YncE